MKIPIYQVDAFTSELFSGNPAAVCLLKRWPDDKILQSVATENNLSETAFVVYKKDAAVLELRWFTPLTEVALCGHATLAAAFILFTHRGWEKKSICFQTRHSGELVVTRKKDMLEMDFPARPVREISEPEGLARALGIKPLCVFDSAEDLLVVLDSEKAVREVTPDFVELEKLRCRGIIITAAGENSDFVSRFFAPCVGIPEDPVTGSAHCVLVPYWSERLRKEELHTYQVSKRGGELFCRHAGKRVKISGKAVLYLEGTVTL